MEVSGLPSDPAARGGPRRSAGFQRAPGVLCRGRTPQCARHSRRGRFPSCAPMPDSISNLPHQWALAATAPIHCSQVSRPQTGMHLDGHVLAKTFP
jgi:hypothetical protein